MKKKKIFALMAAALSLTACSTNDIADITHDDADNVVNVASVTRSPEGGTTTSTSSPMTAPFHLVNKTQQTVYGANYEADFQATLNEDGSVSGYTISNGKILWCNKMSDGVRMDNVFEAFSPLKTAENNASFTTFNIPTDQSSAQKLASADWMTATTTKKKAEATSGLELIFSHRNAKLHFNVTFKGEVEASNVTLSSDNFKVVDFITPCYTATGNSKTIEAIVEADKDYSGVNLIEVTINFDANNSETYKVSLPSGLTQFEEGKQYNFDLVIGHDQATISSVYVTDWGEGSIDLQGNDDALLKIDYTIETIDGRTTYLVYNYDGYNAWIDAAISNAQLSNSSQGYYPEEYNTDVSLKLKKDIYVPAGATLKRIVKEGFNKLTFNGVIDGQGHTIHIASQDLTTFFNGICAYNSGTIKNLNFDIDNIQSQVWVSLVGENNNDGVIENCRLNGDIKVYLMPNGSGYAKQAVGICAYNYGKIIACENNINITSDGSANNPIEAAPICINNYGTIIGCINNGNINISTGDSYQAAAGIVALYLFSGNVVSCVNTGEIISKIAIAYNVYGGNMSHCYWNNSGEGYKAFDSQSSGSVSNCAYAPSWTDEIINNLNTATDGDGNSIEYYGYMFTTDANGKLIIVPYTPSSSSSAARR